MEQLSGIETHVYVIPGGKEDALRAYQQCAGILQKQPMQCVVYRAQHREGMWLIVLMGVKEDMIRYHTDFQRVLSDVHAQSSQLPQRTLMGLAQRFVRTQQEMECSQQTFIERHPGEALDGDGPATS